MNVTLGIYMQIFSSILEHDHKTGSPALLDQLPSSERPQVEQGLKELQRDMETLKGNLGHPNHDKEDVLSKLNKIKVSVGCV